MTSPVLVAGAGPVGLTMAMALKRRGVDVRIVDRAAARTDKSKALVIWPRTLELLDIQGCSRPFIEAGLQAHGARILADDGTDLLIHVRFDTARSDYRYALMIPQSETERLLEEQLAKLGVTVERRVELVSFSEAEDGVNALLRHPDGRDETLHASWLAGCDGAHSTVRHALALPFTGDTMSSDWVLADLQIDGELARDEITICWTPDGVMVFFPIDATRLRVIADVGLAAAEEAPAPTVREIQALIDHRGPKGLHAHDPFWISRFRINERKVKDYRHGRVFLCGDAAHVHSPAGGQGMNTGMQDAFNLAWKLSMVWHGLAGPALLESYSPERSAIGDQVLRAAGNMTKVALMRNPVLMELRSLAVGALGHLPALRQRFVDQLAEVDLHYRDSPLTESPRGAARHPAGGERAPDLLLSPAPSETPRLYDVLATGRFAVLSVSAPLVEMPEALRPIAAAVATEASADYVGGHVYLVRPDGYVALSTGAADTGPILAALERIAQG